MASYRKTVKALAEAVEPYGLHLEDTDQDGATIYQGKRKIVGVKLDQGTASLTGAMRLLRRSGAIPRDEHAASEKTTPVLPADARKARARKKSPAPVTRLPRHEQRVPTPRLGVKDGVRFGVYGPTRVLDSISRVRTAGGKEFTAEETARAAARLAAADRRASRVAVVPDRCDPVVSVEDHSADLAPKAVAAKSDSLSHTDRPLVPVGPAHESPLVILKELFDGLGTHAEIGLVVGLYQNQVSALIAGRTRVTPRSALRIERGLGVEGLAERLVIAQAHADLHEQAELMRLGIVQ